MASELRRAPIDDLVAFALEELLSDDIDRHRGLVRKMCAKWPSVPGLSIVFALSSAAAMIDDNIKGMTGDANASTVAYRLAALLAADIYAIESMGQIPVRSRDLLHFWRRVDPYFLNL